jgi:hypothetical protein
MKSLSAIMVAAGILGCMTRATEAAIERVPLTLDPLTINSQRLAPNAVDDTVQLARGGHHYGGHGHHHHHHGFHHHHGRHFHGHHGGYYRAYYGPRVYYPPIYSYPYGGSSFGLFIGF